MQSRLIVSFRTGSHWHKPVAGMLTFKSVDLSVVDTKKHYKTVLLLFMVKGTNIVSFKFTRTKQFCSQMFT